MGCGPSNSAVATVPADGDGETTGSKAAYPPSEAFEIPLDDESPESLIKKHPPLRLKRLEEHTAAPPSIENLEEKLATAELRRQQFLASRVQKTTTFDKTGHDEEKVIPEGTESGEPLNHKEAGEPTEDGAEETTSAENAEASENS